MGSKTIITFICLSMLFVPLFAQENTGVLQSEPFKINPSELNSDFGKDVRLTHDLTSQMPFPFQPNNTISKFVKLDTLKWVIEKYNGGSTWPFNKWVYISGDCRQQLFIGLGSYYNLMSSIKWTPSDKFAIEGGLLFSRQFGFLNSSRTDLWGANVGISYNITKQLQFKYWGLYMTPNKDIFLGFPSFLPGKSTGASLLYKLTEKTKIGTKIEYQYNNKTNSWNSETNNTLSIGL
jgi:hypothetical protein